MKFHAGQKKQQLDAGLMRLLKELRARRHFQVGPYVVAKVRVMNDYFAKANLKAAVVAVSGGIDSAVVLSLVAKAKAEKGSPIEKIVALSLPIYKSKFTTNQDKATSRAIEVIRASGLQETIYDLTHPYETLKETIDHAIGVEGQSWAAGQLVSYLRTPAMYYTTSLLSQEGTPALVCGTTNRDEGAYLGFVGKASDGMVDIQLISDLHKSEVRSVAKYVGIPKSILNAVPTGDMFDGRIDEEVFGASYDFVELFLLLRAMEDETLKQSLIDVLPTSSKKIYNHLAANVQNLHRYNAHKYRVSSPAVHLDVLESGVKDGWSYSYEKVEREPKGEKNFVNAFTLPKNMNKQFDLAWRPTQPKEQVINAGKFLEMPSVLKKNETTFLLDQVMKRGYKPVGVDGYMSHYKEGDPIGSWRASTFSPELASIIWARISRYFDNPRLFEGNLATDTNSSSLWRPIGISPLFRYIRYTSGGQLVPHYDAPFVYSTKQRTLMSLVMYLATEGVTGGETRFIKDAQVSTPFAERDFSDWTRFAKKNEIILEVIPKVGSAISFDHRMLHDSSEISGQGQKVILRTDIVFVRCN